MADLEQTKTNAKRQLFDEIEGATVGMLGVEGSAQHVQPMAPHVDRATGQIWFYTKRDSDLVAAVGQGKRAHLIIMSTDGDYQASCRGTLVQDYDLEARDQFWSSLVAAWFEDGKDDPNLTMLRFTPHDAAVWASSGNALTFGWEIVKANLTSAMPDTGERAHVTF